MQRPLFSKQATKKPVLETDGSKSEAKLKCSWQITTWSKN